jgi:hypothetical protein
MTTNIRRSMKPGRVLSLTLAFVAREELEIAQQTATNAVTGRNSVTSAGGLLGR